MTIQGIVYAGWDPNWFKAFLGVMLLLAVLVNLYVKKLSSKRKVNWHDRHSRRARRSELHKGEPLIEMADVGKSYGAIRALRGINMHGQRRGGRLCAG